MEQRDEVVDVSAAAVRLGITPDGVRKRIQRGTLRGHKVNGEWRVMLPAVGASVGSDKTDKTLQTVPDSTIAAWHRERERLLGIIERQAVTIEELSRRLPELPAAGQPPTPDTPTTATRRESDAARADRESPATRTGRRPWWAFWRA